MTALGADHVIDYTSEDFTRNGKTYDVIFDVVSKAHYSRSLASLKPEGCYLLGAPSLLQMLRSVCSGLFSKKKVYVELASHSTTDLNYLKGQIEQGAIRSMIDKRFSLEQAAEAHRYIDSDRKAGSVVLSLVRDQLNTQ